jgi:ACS family hexuronate transporter-like MFS transporter
MTLKSPGLLATAFDWKWVICLLLFLATAINYMDRSVLGILAHTLDVELHWSEDAYADIVVAFTFAYGVGYLVAGRVVDYVGAKNGYAIFVFFWTIAAMAHAFTTTVLGFGTARFFLGFAESGNFPAAIRVVSEWFPIEQRALVTALFNSGSNLASLFAPLLVAALITRFHSWRAAFLGVGVLGVIWLILWLAFPYSRLRLRRDTLTDPVIDGRNLQAPMAWKELLALRATWALIIAKAATDPVWWLYLFWLPKFLQQKFHLSVAEIGWPLATVYCLASIGAILGGWASGAMLKHGVPVLSARKRVLAACAVVAPTLILATHLHSLRQVIALFSLLTAAHQAWAANLFTLNSDLIPRPSLSTSVGISGAAGAIGGVGFQFLTGQLLAWSGGNYEVIFALGGCAYAGSLLMLHLLTRRPIESLPALV